MRDRYRGVTHRHDVAPPGRQAVAPEPWITPEHLDLAGERRIGKRLHRRLHASRPARQAQYMGFRVTPP